MSNIKNITAYMNSGLVSIMYFDDELQPLPDFELNEIRTTEQYTTFDLSTLQPRNLKIQSRYNSRYRLIFFCNSNQNITNLRLAKYLTVELLSGEVFYIDTNEISLSEIAQWNQYKVTIPLIRLFEGVENIENYLTMPEIRGRDADGDYILTDAGLNSLGKPKLHKIGIASFPAVYFYTIINPNFKISETQVIENTRNFTRYLDRSGNFNVIELTCYLTEAQLLDLKAIQDNTVTVSITNGFAYTDYVGIEYVLPEVRKIESAYQIYEVKFNVKYSLNEYNK